MSRYANIVANPTQREQSNPREVLNNAGGYVYVLDKWARLDRFLILGSDGGTYYVTERPLTLDNAKVIQECLGEDGLRTVNRIVEISDGGRAPKNDPALFALALAASHSDPKTRAAALQALPQVVRIGTHLFHFAEDVQKFRGWGRGLREAVSNWYNNRPIDKLALQLVKYRQRDGWSHRDMMRLSHPYPENQERANLYKWATKPDGEHGSLPEIVEGFTKLQAMKTGKDAAVLIRKHRLPRECVPTELLNDKAVWEALLEDMGPTALVRNLGKLSALEMTKPLSSTTKRVVKELTDRETIKRSRIHPMAVLIGMRTYANGHGEKGKLSWSANQQIIDALDQAFYLAFDNVEPTKKNFLIGLDVSGSMGSAISGSIPMSCREAAAALAAVTTRTEPYCHTVGFTSTGSYHSGTGLTTIDVKHNERVNDYAMRVANMPFGATDCALPMLYATKNKLEVDAFLVMTDNETFAGNVKPVNALRKYRQKMARNAKLIVIGMTSTGFSIADSSDPGMLDCVGFDTSVPSVVSEFVR